MATSLRQFNVELYEEHLEEASALYEQRLALLADPEVTWLDIEEFEDRLEAHVDALVVGGELALEVCGEHAAQGDSGELYACICVFCRQGRKDLVSAAWTGAALEDAEQVRAVVDALRDECPAAWLGDLERILAQGNDRLLCVIAGVLGARRRPCQAQLLARLKDASAGDLPAMVAALGRVGGAGAREALRQVLSESDGDLARDTAICLLRLGDGQTRERLLVAVADQSWAAVPAALCGAGETHQRLMARASAGAGGPQTLVALGLIGDAGALPVLLQSLADPALAESAAMGLQLLTGASLYEEVFVPEAMDEDELFEQELEAYRKDASLPKRPDGQPYGENVQRLAQDPALWRDWLQSPPMPFQARVRYRWGQPCSPSALHLSLAADQGCQAIRAYAGDELMIRYGLDHGVETDMRVAVQRRALEALRARLPELDKRFAPGRWYFAGQRV